MITAMGQRGIIACVVYTPPRVQTKSIFSKLAALVRCLKSAPSSDISSSWTTIHRLYRHYRDSSNVGSYGSYIPNSSATSASDRRLTERSSPSLRSHIVEVETLPAFYPTT